MEYRTLELNVVSAKDIKDVNLLSKMDVYAIVSLSGDPQNPQKTKTPVHRDGGTIPTWNFPVKFTVNESLAHQNRLSLEINLFSDRTLAGDTLAGTVHVPVKELIDNPSDDSFRHVSYQVRTQSGKAKGSLNLSYKFGEKVTAPAKAEPASTPMAYPPPGAYPPPAAGSKQQEEQPMGYPPSPVGSKQEPVMAYPVTTAVEGSSTAHPYGVASYAPPPQQYGYGYPSTQQPGYGYLPPQQPGYGYPPQPGYGYPPTQQPGYGYPPPQQPGYGYPPQPGYGYPSQPGYGYPPAQQQGKKKKKNKFGMGLGAGLLGGALGGLLIGDMVSDVADYDAGYDAGFDDGGGFDF